MTIITMIIRMTIITIIKIIIITTTTIIIIMTNWACAARTYALSSTSADVGAIPSACNSGVYNREASRKDRAKEKNRGGMRGK
jgi:hypothetical protein